MSPAIRVLIVEDNPADAELIARELGLAGFDPKWQRVETEPDFLAELKESPDIILSDYSMPQFSGLRALELLKQSGLDVPFILISGTLGDERAVEAMKHGVTDYLLKDRIARLGHAVENALEQKRLRAERQRAEERVLEQAGMLDHAHNAIIVRDIQTGQITFWNQGAEHLYGWTAGEAVGRHVGKLIFTDPGALVAINAQLLKTGEWQGEQRHLSKAGLELRISGHVTLVRDANGTPKSALVINIDITEQKKLEAQFLRAQRMESIGSLASGVAHDLNNIFAPILMSAPMLRDELPPDLRETILSTIETSAQRGADIVKQVLTFARGVEGERVLVQPTHLIKEMADIAQQTFPKSITIRPRYSNGIWAVEGDPTQLHQVLLNLCVNARDAMPNGGELTVALENFTVDEQYAGMMPDSKTGPYVIITVSDTGTGIPRAIIDKIFDPFFTTKDLGKGTGLGLATVAGIAKGHGGFVTVDSDAGRGTTFRVFLPATGNEGAAGPATETVSLPLGHGELVLVVDDEQSILLITQTMLEKYGYHVVTAADGTGALTLFAKQMNEIKVVLTDVIMPFMDGAVLARVLKRMNPQTPVIACSGQREEVCEAELRDFGVNVFLRKPYNTEKLLTALRSVLDDPAGDQNGREKADRATHSAPSCYAEAVETTVRKAQLNRRTKVER